jgi:hypothetical protein
MAGLDLGIDGDAFSGHSMPPNLVIAFPSAKPGKTVLLEDVADGGTEVVHSQKVSRQIEILNARSFENAKTHYAINRIESYPRNPQCDSMT